MKAVFEFDSQINQFSEAPVGLNMHYALVPARVIMKIKSPLPARFVVIMEGEKWHGAVMSMGNGSGFVMVNKAMLKKLHLQIHSKVKVRLEPETSPYTRQATQPHSLCGENQKSAVAHRQIALFNV